MPCGHQLANSPCPFPHFNPDGTTNHRLRHQRTMPKSLVISRRGERSEGGEARQTNRCASFTLCLLFQQRAHFLQGRKLLQGAQIQIVQQLTGGRKQFGTAGRIAVACHFYPAAPLQRFEYG